MMPARGGSPYDAVLGLLRIPLRTPPLRGDDPATAAVGERPRFLLLSPLARRSTITPAYYRRLPLLSPLAWRSTTAAVLAEPFVVLSLSLLASAPPVVVAVLSLLL